VAENGTDWLTLTETGKNSLHKNRPRRLKRTSRDFIIGRASSFYKNKE